MAHGSTTSAPCCQQKLVRRHDTAILANGFSNFFKDKVQRIKTAVDAGLRLIQSPITPCPPPSVPSATLSSFVTVTAAEVDRLIRTAPTKTSPLDTLPISLLKQCSAELSSVIAHLANRSFATGKFPASMKNGLVTPLIKKPGLDVSYFKNFRLIMNLSTVSKLLERLALAWIKPHSYFIEFLSSTVCLPWCSLDRDCTRKDS